MAIKVQTDSAIGGYRCGGPTWTSVQKERFRAELQVSVSNNPGGNNPFRSEKSETTGSLLENKPDAPYGAQNPGFSACPSGFYDLPLGFATNEIVSSDFTTLFARSNPANPRFLAPAFIAELRDAPDLIRQGGRIADAIRNGKNWRNLIRSRSAVSDAAVANLSIQFGWKPFLSDLLTIATFQESLAKTAAMMEKLEKKGLRGKVPLGDTHSKSGYSWPVHSTCGYVQYVTVEEERTTRKWGSVRWTANKPYLPRGKPEIFRRAAGFTADNIPLAVWEALPWSWLVDYFVNIGDLIKSGNRVIATPSHACVMVEAVTTARHKGKDFDDFRRITDGVKMAVQHSRMPYGFQSPLPSIPMPILSAGQLSILGSLHVSRAYRGRRSL